MRQRFSALGIALAAGLLVSASLGAGLFAGLENFFEDLLFFEKPIHGDIVIVAIDDESLSRIGQWPWPRQVFADFLKALEKTPPRVVALDVLFAEPSRVGREDDEAFSRALRTLSYSVVLPVEGREIRLDGERGVETDFLIEPREEFRGSRRVAFGHVNVIEDRDGVVRRFPLALRHGEREFSAFALTALREGGVELPTIASLPATPRIVYAGAPGKVRRVPFFRVLDGSVNLQDKIIFVGATAPDLHDDRVTPVSAGTAMPGVEIHAHIAEMLMSGARLDVLGILPTLLWIMGASIATALLFRLAPSLAIALAAITLGAVVSLIAIISLFSRGIAPNLIHIEGAWMLASIALSGYRYFVGESEKRELTKVFSKYVSSEVLTEILRDPAKVRLGGEEREITILFSDIRDFTTLSEKTAPTELVRTLNRYFTEMTDEILLRGGVVDKYIGDAIMAFWGAPVDDPEQADHALQAALGMIQRLRALNADFRLHGEPEIRIGVGIHTGPAVVGNVGSELRFDYTAIGDTVNAASRIEGLTKQYQTPILLGESTRKKLTIDVPLVELGEASVKGKEAKIRLYGVKMGV